MKKKRMAIVLGLLAVLIAGVIGVLFFANTSHGISFKENLPEKFTVNQKVNLERYINNPKGKELELKAEYEQNGKTSEYSVKDLTFMPNCEGEVKLTVSVAGTKNSVDTTMQVVDNAPVVVSVMEDVTYLLDETIELSELYDYITYESQAKPEIKVEKVEYAKGLVRIKDETTFTFDEPGAYEFFVRASNSGGSVLTTLHINAELELTDNEVNDLTNKVVKTGNSSYAMISLSEEEHSKNSDWAWKIAADPEATMASSNSTRCRVSIDFGKEIIPEREYFTMDVKMTKDAGELMVRYLDRDGNRVLDRYFAEPKGEWFEITSEKTYGDIEIAGVMLIIMHPKEEKASVYDANNVSVLIDNCYLHVREGYVATKNKVVPASGKDGSAQLAVYGGSAARASYLQIEGNYTNECFEFTTTMTESGVYIGARLDKVSTKIQDSNGLVVLVRYNRMDYYVPKFNAEHKGAFRYWQYGVSNLEIGKDYTFTVWVVEGEKAGTNNLVVRIKDGDKVLAIFESDTCKDIRNDGDITKQVAKKGCFAVWSLDLSRKITYRMPYHSEIPKSVNKIVPSTDTEGGVAEISPAVPGKNRSAAYLKMDGNYTDEGFTFKTKVTENGFYVGARLNQVTQDVTDSAGILVYVRHNRIDYYTPVFDNEHKGAFRFWQYGMSNLEIGKEYTFTVWVTEGSTPGTNNLVIRVKDGDKVIGVFEHENCQDIRNGGNISSGVGKSGSFAVWSVDETRTITYEMPADLEVPKTINKVVSPLETEGGVAELSSAVQGTNRNASYLKMEGAYKNEGFTFTTKWSGTDLYIGARLDQVTSDVLASNGIIVLVRRDRIYYYSPKFDDVMRGRINYGDYGMSALTEGKDYTFTVWVTEGTTAGTNNLVIQIKDGDKIIGLFNHETCKDVRNDGDLATGVPETGSFAVWSLDETRTIEYTIPVVSEIPRQVNKIVESSETTGGVAELASAVEGSNSNASYLQMQGAYTNEGFTFKTTWNDTYLHVGARLDQVTSEVRDSSGVIMQIRKDRIVYYSPKFDAKQRGTILFNKYGMDTPLVNGNEYTFTVWVTEGSTPGKNNLIIQITNSNGVQNVLDHETCVDIRNDGDINTGVPASGSFAVWSIDKERSITYEIPKQTAIPTQGISKSLTPVVASNHGNTGFTNVNGSYGAEGFEITTKVTKDMSLYLGARMNSSRVTQDLYNARGIIIGIKHDRIYYYSPRWHSSENWREGYVKFASIGKSGLTPDKDYTFTVWVTDGSTSGTYNVVVQIKDGTNVHSVINFETQAVKETDKGGGSFLVTDNIPATGSFAVWSIEQRQIKYRILHGVTAPAVQ